jgi:NitT/TauT family transport system substrate-binding protein
MKIQGILAAAVMALSSACHAQTPEKPNVKIAMDWAFEGIHIPFARAVDGGYYKREGLNVTFDRGFGSGDTIAKVAARSYDFGFADANALVKFNAEHPDSRVISVFQAFDRTLAAAITLKSDGIVKPTDFAGKTLAGSEGDASRLLFPAFARLVGLDASSVHWLSVASNLREAMVIKKRAQGMIGFSSTAYFNLKAAGVPPDDILVFPYADYGLDLYGNAVVTRQDFAEQNPKTVAAFVEGTIAGMLDAWKDPERGIAGLKQRDSLMNTTLELDRWKYVAKNAIDTANVRQNGLGAISDDRLKRSIAYLSEAFNVKDAPTPDQVATTRFLPPQKQRMLPQ